MRIHHAITAVLAGMLASTAVAAAAGLQPGTYDAGANELVMVRAAHGRLAFGINAIRQLDKHTGYINGAIPTGSNVVFVTSGNGILCRLRFVATGAASIRVTQDTRFGDCGFGYGVTADGLYVRTRSGGTIRPWNGP